MGFVVREGWGKRLLRHQGPTQGIAMALPGELTAVGTPPALSAFPSAPIDAAVCVVHTSTTVLCFGKEMSQHHGALLNPIKLSFLLMLS